MPESLALLAAAITIHHDYLEQRRIAQLTESAAIRLRYKLTAFYAGERSPTRISQTRSARRLRSTVPDVGRSVALPHQASPPALLEPMLAAPIMRSLTVSARHRPSLRHSDCTASPWRVYSLCGHSVALAGVVWRRGERRRRGRVGRFGVR